MFCNKQAEDRTVIKHIKSLFKVEVLAHNYEYFKTSAGSYNNLTDSSLSDRERAAVERGESSDKMRLQEIWYEIWKTAEVNRLLDEFGPFLYVSYPPQVRHVRQVSHNVPWHQDIAYMRALGPKGHQQIITCFVPLEPNPDKCTTLQFANDDVANSEVTHSSYNGFGAGFNGDSLNNKFHFNLHLGDVLVFGDFAIHRTYTPENCNIERRSLEFRLVKKEHLLPGKDYFDIKQQKFIKT